MTAIRPIAILLVALLALTAGCAQKQPPGPPPSGTVSEGLISVTARVKKIDHKTRKVTLEMPDGTTRTVTVDPKVQNLAQVKAGDSVNASFFESIAFAVRRKGEATPGVTVAEDAVRAAPGQRPGAAAAVVTTITATITGIDKKAGTVTLTMPDGEVETIKVRDAANLDRVVKGDLVDLTLTEALAIAVEAAPAAK